MFELIGWILHMYLLGHKSLVENIYTMFNPFIKHGTNFYDNFLINILLKVTMS